MDTLSLKALRHRLDKRKLQEELDLHKLFLLTAYHARLRTGTDIPIEVAAVLDAEAQSLGHQGLKSAVSGFLSIQLVHLARTLHTTLSHPSLNDAAPAESLAALWKAQRDSKQALLHSPYQHTPKGLGASFGSAINTTTAPPPPMPPPLLRLSQSQVSEAFQQASGFTLGIAPSSVQHADAGDGLWLQGRARVGQVIGIYPGCAYPPSFHRDIPGYPLVARSNPFLLSRFDGIVLDAKPWGRGRGGGSCSGNGGDVSSWPHYDQDTLTPYNAAEAGLARLEGRNPLALAHLANHPPAGTSPNVVVAAVDWENSTPSSSLPSMGEAKWEEEGEQIEKGKGVLRAYIPVVQLTSDGKRDGEMLPGEEDAVPCVALVATREIEDEEVFLNYRLNPNAPGGVPEWYTPVDAAEDARRWT